MQNFLNTQSETSRSMKIMGCFTLICFCFTLFIVVVAVIANVVSKSEGSNGQTRSQKNDGTKVDAAIERLLQANYSDKLKFKIEVMESLKFPCMSVIREFVRNNKQLNLNVSFWSFSVISFNHNVSDHSSEIKVRSVSQKQNIDFQLRRFQVNQYEVNKVFVNDVLVWGRGNSVIDFNNNSRDGGVELTIYDTKQQSIDNNVYMKNFNQMNPNSTFIK